MAAGVYSAFGWGRGGRARLGVVLLIAASALTLSALAPGGVERAHAAPCTANYSSAGGTFTAQGDLAICTTFDEGIRVFCEAGTVRVDYWEQSPPGFGPEDSAEQCAGFSTVLLIGDGGNDVLDITGVTRANGFTALQSGVVDAGTGNDLIFVRNGSNDSVDCGSGFDAVQSDHAGLDSAVNCEINDIAPTPPAAILPPAPAPAAPAKKCKKKRRSAATAKKKRCKKKRR